MTQSAQRTGISWSILAILLVAAIGFGNIWSSRPSGLSTHGNTHTVPSQSYPGPTYDYSMTPNPCSLTYVNPCSYHGDTLRQVRQELAKAE
jgi:hypothetical protein